MTLKTLDDFRIYLKVKVHKKNLPTLILSEFNF